jgi:hypothetical protein
LIRAIKDTNRFEEMKGTREGEGENGRRGERERGR